MTQLVLYFFFMMRHPPSSTLFPYTTLFRSLGHEIAGLTWARWRDHARTTQTGCAIALAFRICPENERADVGDRSEEHTSELQSRRDLVCRLLLEKKKLRGTKGTLKDARLWY